MGTILGHELKTRHPMITENEKVQQIRVQLSLSPCHVSFINQEHGLIHTEKGKHGHLDLDMPMVYNAYAVR